MRIYLVLTTILIFSLFINGSGCNKVATPVKEETEGEGENGDETPDVIQIVADKNEILDTEPLLFEAQGGSGLITWFTEPPFENCFSSLTDTSVLFKPPDVSQNMVITIKAIDEKGVSGQAAISIIDEGNPPQVGEILINEIAWAGTLKSSYDEYIELINRTDRSFYLNSWVVENAAGTGIPLTFSGKILGSSLFLITNYAQDGEQTAIICPVSFVSPDLSLKNDQFGPYILKNQTGTVFDTVGDGGKSYPYGLNDQDIKSSLCRYTYSNSTVWDSNSWYTECVSINFKDGTLGTPGAPNSDSPYNTGATEDDALAIITEYFIDANDQIGEDWVELCITKSGNIKNFTLTDLDGTDPSITNGIDVYLSEGDYVILIWSTSYIQDGNQFYIPDTNPTGTKDELVLLCDTHFLDGLCYTSDGLNPDDYNRLVDEYGWQGLPINGKHASKRIDENANYINDREASSWDTEKGPTPGKVN